MVPDTAMGAQLYTIKSLFYILILNAHYTLISDALPARQDVENWRNYKRLAQKCAPFNCTILKSPAKPTSVHRLMPGDIDVVAALGDSLTAANGAAADNVVEMILQYEGLSFSIGGDDKYETACTLPNIIKKYNPNVYGWSERVAISGNPDARFNMGVPGAKSETAIKQAKKLVELMKKDHNVDMDNHWKVVTIFFGANSLCNYCGDHVEYSAERYVNNLKEALDYLQENLPRTFVNLVTTINVTFTNELTRGEICRLMNTIECPCAEHPVGSKEVKDLLQAVIDYTEKAIDLVESGRYDTRDDFTVVAQPFLKHTRPPFIKKDNKTVPDLSYFAPDCFHFSTKSHAGTAMSLWNNMVEKVGKKSTTWVSVKGPVKCPTKKSPFFFTNKNSKWKPEL